MRFSARRYFADPAPVLLRSHEESHQREATVSPCARTSAHSCEGERASEREMRGLASSFAVAMSKSAIEPFSQPSMRGLARPVQLVCQRRTLAQHSRHAWQQKSDTPVAVLVFEYNKQ